MIISFGLCLVVLSTFFYNIFYFSLLPPFTLQLFGAFGALTVLFFIKKGEQYEEDELEEESERKGPIREGTESDDKKQTEKLESE